ncbi:MAG: hypothetical protein CMO01_09265 [Thalassobius sp.]|nr:hypothetical protein [Thalassovita sp.]
MTLIHGKHLKNATILGQKIDLTGYTASQPGQVTSLQVVNDRINAEKLKVAAGSGAYVEIVNNELKIKATAIASVTVNAVAVDLTSFIASNYTTGDEFQEGDTIVLKSATGGIKTYLHTGGSAINENDFVELEKPPLEDAYIRALFEAGEGLSYDEATGKFSLNNLLEQPLEYKAGGENGELLTGIGQYWDTMMLDSDGKIYATRYANLYVYDPSTQSLTTYNNSTVVSSGDAFPSGNINGNNIMFKDGDEIYLPYNVSGIFRYNLVTGEGKVFNTSGGAANGAQLPSNNVRSVDGFNNYIVAATSAGLWIYDKSTDTGTVITNGSSFSSGSAFQDNDIYNVQIDDNTIYLDADYEGIWVYDILNDAAQSFNNSNSGLPSSIQQFLTVSPNYIFNPMDESGVSMHNRITGIHTFLDASYVPSNGVSLPANIVYQTAWDGEELACVYTDGNTLTGIWFYNPTTDEGRLLNSATSVSGDAVPSLPTQEFKLVARDKTNDITYIALSDNPFLYKHSIAAGAEPTLPQHLATIKTVEEKIAASQGSFEEGIVQQNPSSILSGDNQNTGIALPKKPKPGLIFVTINSTVHRLGNGVKTMPFYFSVDGGTTAKTFEELAIGDTLFFNGAITGFDLDTNDSIDVYYNA